MWRSLGVVFAVTGICFPPAIAQTHVESACPGAPLSLYFASGDVTASPQTDVLIGRIGETATTCQADRIDLIAHIDATADGDRAVRVGRRGDDGNEALIRGARSADSCASISPARKPAIGACTCS